MGVWNAKGSRRLFTELRRRRKRDATDLCDCRTDMHGNGEQRFTGVPVPGSSSGRLRSQDLCSQPNTRPPVPWAPFCLRAIGPPVVHTGCLQAVHIASLLRSRHTPPSWDWGLPEGSSTMPYRLPFAGDCFCLRLGSKHQESPLPALDARGHWAPPVGLRTSCPRLRGWVYAVRPPGGV